MIQKRAVTGNGVQLVADVELLFFLLEALSCIGVRRVLYASSSSSVTCVTSNEGLDTGHRKGDVSTKRLHLRNVCDAAYLV